MIINITNIMVSFKNSVKGFTLIELLVVITIIGILAVGGIGVYNSQIEKARDAVRIQDMQKLSAAAEQFYQDGQGYPTANDDAGTGVMSGAINVYMQKAPQDPKSGQATKDKVFDYYYNVMANDSGVAEQWYEFSTALENAGNIKNKAANDKGDGGNDEVRLEVGNKTNKVNTKCKTSPAKNKTDNCKGQIIKK